MNPTKPRAPLGPNVLGPLRAPASSAVQTGDIPGVVALTWQSGEILDVHAAGVADVATGRPMEYSAIFPIASMSKPITVAAALRLLDQGKLRLEDPITRWAPEFANMRVLKRADGPLEETYPAPRAITIEDLMTHRSGFSYGFTSRGPLAAALLQTLGYGVHSPLNPDAWLAALAALPLACAPGERFEYGHSIDVLGFIVGRAAGSNLQDALHEELFEPLGMADTGFWVPPEKRDRLVVNTISSAPGAFVAAPIEGYTTPEPPSYASGGQGMVSTAADYLAFARMLLRAGETPGGQLLKAETVKLMITNRLTPAQRANTLMGMPLFAHGGLGLGVSVVIDAAGHSVRGAAEAGAFGWPGAFGGWWQADPAADTILIWLQACLPPPPSGGQLPRLPGAAALIEFQRAAYSVAT
jgi:CubicO group peptidase (beta-lactamase class C family)